MSNDTFLYWGMVVTLFLGLAALLTARELLVGYLERRGGSDGDET